jgi:hypothetical protein
VIRERRAEDSELISQGQQWLPAPEWKKAEVRNAAPERLENGETALGVGIRTARTVDIARMM